MLVSFLPGNRSVYGGASREFLEKQYQFTPLYYENKTFPYFLSIYSKITEAKRKHGVPNSVA